MDSGTIFYLIAIIAYFIYTSFISKKGEKKMDTGDGDSDTASPPKGVSFDDLLKEIRKEQTEREADIEHTGENTSMDYEEEFEEAESVVSEIPAPNPSTGQYGHEERPDTYRDIKQPMVKLDDQVDINDEKKILGDVEDVAEELQGNSKYASMLKNSNQIKDAVILAEILNRRHF